MTRLRHSSRPVRVDPVGLGVDTGGAIPCPAELELPDGCPVDPLGLGPDDALLDGGALLVGGALVVGGGATYW